MPSIGNSILIEIGYHQNVNNVFSMCISTFLWSSYIRHCGLSHSSYTCSLIKLANARALSLLITTFVFAIGSVHKHQHQKYNLHLAHQWTKIFKCCVETNKNALNQYAIGIERKQKKWHLLMLINPVAFAYVFRREKKTPLTQFRFPFNVEPF